MPDRPPPVVSVLMPTYRNASFIEQAIRSVLDQTYPALELVVSDNASDDDTEARVRALAATDDRIRYFRNERNIGIAPNFNAAFERSDPGSGFIALLPSDDWWEPTFLEEVVRIAESEPDVDLVHTDLFHTAPDGTPLYRNRDHPRFRRFLPPPGRHRAIDNLMGHSFIHGPAALLRRRALMERYGGRPFFLPDYRYVADLHLWMQLLVAGAEAWYLERPLVYFRGHSGSMTKKSGADAAGIARLHEEIDLLERRIPTPLPGRLEPLRRLELSKRYGALGFRQLSNGSFREARRSLSTSRRLSPRTRRDVATAALIAALPLPRPLRRNTWRLLARVLEPRDPPIGPGPVGLADGAASTLAEVIRRPPEGRRDDAGSGRDRA